MLKKTSNWFKS